LREDFHRKDLSKTIDVFAAARNKVGARNSIMAMRKKLYRWNQGEYGECPDKFYYSIREKRKRWQEGALAGYCFVTVRRFRLSKTYLL
jgi:hypothetical protein